MDIDPNEEAARESVPTEDDVRRLMWLGARRGALWALVLCAIAGFFVLRSAYRVGRDRGIEIESERVYVRERESQLEPAPVDAYPRPRPERRRPVPLPGRARSAQEGAPPAAEPPGRARKSAASEAGARDPSRGDGATDWVFTPAECVRVVWPMEIVPHEGVRDEGVPDEEDEEADAGGGPAAGPGKSDAAVRQAHGGALSLSKGAADEEAVPLEGARFRLRQGANRLCRPGMGLAEFVFELDRPSLVNVRLRCRHLDECGNSVRCTIDGTISTVVGRKKVFGQWLWESARRGFVLGPGLHRLTLSACEDGIEFDRVALRIVRAGVGGVVWGTGPGGVPGVVQGMGPGAAPGAEPGAAADIDRAAPTQPPVFESLPRVAPTLPRIATVTAQAFASGSMVVGRGHRNLLSVFVRRNGAEPVVGTVRVRCPYGRYFDMRGFRLTGGVRARLLRFDLALQPSLVYLMPLRCEVVANGETVLSQRIDFVRPLSWAFLGPFPDPEGDGLDLALPPDGAVGALHTLPAFSDLPGGLAWKVVEDGSCYDSFGVVDLNKVFRMANLPWDEKRPDTRRFVAYAVTAVRSGGSRHDTLAFAGDDAVRVWLNGRQLMSVDSRTPIETCRQVVGTKLRRGPNFFVFKTAQRGFYWKMLFEPDNTLPYGRADNLMPLPAGMWGRPPPEHPPHVIIRGIH